MGSVKKARWIQCLFVVIFSLFIQSTPLYARENAGGISKIGSDVDETRQYVDKWLDSMDMDALEDGMEKLFPEFEIRTQELLNLIMEGEILEAGKELLLQVGESFKGELLNLRRIFLY